MDVCGDLVSRIVHSMDTYPFSSFLRKEVGLGRLIISSGEKAMGNVSSNDGPLFFMYALGTLSPSVHKDMEQRIKTELRSLVRLFRMCPDSIPKEIQDWLKEKDPNLGPALHAVLSVDHAWLEQLFEAGSFSDTVIQSVILQKGMGDEEYALAYNVPAPLMAMADDISDEIVKRMGEQN